MATLTTPQLLHVADKGRVEFTVTPTPFGDAVLFERAVPFAATAATAPPFRRVHRVFTEDRNDPYTSAASLGSLYQARLYKRYDVDDDQMPGDEVVPIGRLDLPCISVESRSEVLTRCAGRAQINVGVGGNYVSVAVATGNAKSRAILLVGDRAPRELDIGQGHLVPFFNDMPAISFATSTQSDRLHRVFAPPSASVSLTDRIYPQQSLWYIALVWEADGKWDYVWSDNGVGGIADAQQLTALTRTITLDVNRLTCVDDATYDGEDDPVTFTLALQDAGGDDLATDTYDWDGMDSGDTRAPNRRLALEWSGGAESDGARVSVRAGKNWHGETDIPLPIGEGSLSTTSTLRIKQDVLSGQPGFYADLTATIDYA
jgi:hypothetical protein